MIKYKEFCFVVTTIRRWAIKVGTQACPPAYHLPEFHFRFYWLGEYQVEHLRYIDTGIEHVNGYGNGDLTVFTIGGLKVIDQLFSALVLGVNHSTEITSIFRIHFGK